MWVFRVKTHTSGSTGNKKDVFLCCQEPPPPPRPPSFLKRLERSGKSMHPPCLCCFCVCSSSLYLTHDHRRSRGETRRLVRVQVQACHVLFSRSPSGRLKPLSFRSSVLGQLEESDDTQQHFRKIIHIFSRSGVFFFVFLPPPPQFLDSQQENEQLLKFALHFPLKISLSVVLDSDQ